MNDLCKCNSCRTEIEWEGSSYTNGHIWECERCNTLVCSKCIEDITLKPLTSDSKILCPDCLGSFYISKNITDITFGDVYNVNELDNGEFDFQIEGFSPDINDELDLFAGVLINKDTPTKKEAYLFIREEGKELPYRFSDEQIALLSNKVDQYISKKGWVSL